MALARVSSRPSSAVPNRDCRRNRERPDPTPSHSPSNSVGPVQPHPMRIGLDDNQTNWDETAVRSVVLTSPSRRPGRSDPRLSGSPAFFPLRWPSVSLPSGPAAENNCPTTSDSKACKDYLSDLFQTPQSTVRRFLCSFICLDPLIRLPNFMLRNQEGFCLVHQLLPYRVDRRIWLCCTAPWLHPFIEDFIATTGCSVPETPHPYSRPRGSSTCDFFVNIGISGFPRSV